MEKLMELKFSLMLSGLIRKNGLSITALSRKTNIPVQTLHGWLNGTIPKDVRQVKILADYFKVTLDYIFYGVEAKKAPEIESGVYEVVLRKIICPPENILDSMY